MKYINGYLKHIRLEMKIVPQGHNQGQSRCQQFLASDRLAIRYRKDNSTIWQP